MNKNQHNKKPELKFATYSIENDGNPFIFHVTPQVIQELEPYQTEDGSVGIDAQGNLNISFGDSPTLILGSADEKSIEDGFWINDMDNVTILPTSEQPSQPFGIQIHKGMTTFHVVCIIQPDEIIDSEQSPFGEALYNEMGDADAVDAAEAPDILFNQEFDLLSGEEEVSFTVDPIADSSFEPKLLPAPQEQHFPNLHTGKDRFYHIHQLDRDPQFDTLLGLIDRIIEHEQSMLRERGAHAAGNLSSEMVMSSLPGLAHVTGRTSYARQQLKAYVRLIDRYLATAHKQDVSLDEQVLQSLLWFPIVSYSFVNATGDYAFAKSKLWPSMKRIVEAVRARNQFDLALNSDALLCDVSGQPTSVAMHALWYNTLRISHVYAVRFHDDFSAYESHHKTLKQNFMKHLWSDDAKYFVQHQSDSVQDLSPEHMLVVSLPYALLTTTRQKHVVSRLWKELYTPFGFRKVAGASSQKGIDSIRRKAHPAAVVDDQVWGSYVGSFVTSYIKTEGYTVESREFARQAFVAPLLDYLSTVDLEEFAKQALTAKSDESHLLWNISEIVRSYIEDIHQKKQRR
jgi:hypothetical protein